jgi:ParB-like chromosome segregation protein Spo0J
MIEASLQHLGKPIGDFSPDPKNVRTHSERNIKSVMNSLKQFGQQKPVVALPDGTIIAGNATLAAAKRLGWDEIAVSVFTGPQSAATAYAITDNRTAELADWDTYELHEQLSQVADEFDVHELGWTDAEVLALVDTGETPMDHIAEPLKMGHPLRLTEGQREIVDAAIRVMREEAEDLDMQEGRAVELICADYLSGKA